MYCSKTTSANCDVLSIFDYLSPAGLHETIELCPSPIWRLPIDFRSISFPIVHKESRGTTLSLILCRMKNKRDWRAWCAGQECGELCNLLLVQLLAKPTARKTVSRRLQYFLRPAIFQLRVNFEHGNPAKRRYRYLLAKSL